MCVRFAHTNVFKYIGQDRVLHGRKRKCVVSSLSLWETDRTLDIVSSVLHKTYKGKSICERGDRILWGPLPLYGRETVTGHPCLVLREYRAS